MFDEKEETWVEWIHRATNIAEDSLRKAGLDDWVVGQRRKYFRWAGHVTRRVDRRWSTRLLDWRPVEGEKISRPTSETLGGSVSCVLLLLHRDGTRDGTRRVAFHRTR